LRTPLLVNETTGTLPVEPLIAPVIDTVRGARRTRVKGSVLYSLTTKSIVKVAVSALCLDAVAWLHISAGGVHISSVGRHVEIEAISDSWSLAVVDEATCDKVGALVSVEMNLCCLAIGTRSDGRGGEARHGYQDRGEDRGMHCKYQDESGNREKE
jgi:hypothetical protein